uniref:Uncharacterized protein n=1 Tax=Rhizophora mucronata TaxID=61149 RepID=A0A2P2NKF1_RHIMU
MREVAPASASQSQGNLLASIKLGNCMGGFHGKGLYGQLRDLRAEVLGFHHTFTCRWLKHNQESWQIRGSEIYLRQVVDYCSQAINVKIRN